MDQTQVQFIVGVVVPYILEWLKKASWFPLLTERSTKIWKRVVSAIVAAGSAFAVSFSFDPTVGTLTIAGLTLANLGHALGAFLFSFIAQQIGYKALVQPNGGPAVDVGMLKNLNTSNARNVLPILVALTLVVPLVGCAKKAPVTKIDAGILVVLGTVQDVEMTLHTSLPPVIGDDLHGRFNQRLVPILRLGQRFNVVVRDWPVGTSRPAEVGKVALDISLGLQQLLAMLPDSPTIMTLRLYIQSAIGLLQPFLGA